MIASNSHFLAKALLKQHIALSGGSSNPKDVPGPSFEGPNLQEALFLSHRAVEIFTRLRNPEWLKEAQETLAEIEKKVNSEQREESSTLVE